MIIFLVLESILIGVFSSFDLLIFYLLFEVVLILMYFLIGIFGLRERKIWVLYLFFFYIFLSFIIMFIVILFLYSKFGIMNYFFLFIIKLDFFVEKLC